MQYKEIKKDGFEFVLSASDDRYGFTSIVALHSTTLGPAFGGCRIRRYDNHEYAMLDAMLLAQSMTYKSAYYDLPFGGGKAVVIGDASDPRKEEWLSLFADVLNKLDGLYETADDMGTSVADMEFLRTLTPYARGIYNKDGSQIPATSYGVYQAMRAAAKKIYNVDSLCNLKIAVQGLGKVGWSLCEYLYREDAHLIVADLDEKRVARAVDIFNAEKYDVHKIHAAQADLFCPCASGSVLNAQNIHELKAKVIVGGANNPISDSYIEEEIYSRGIIYIPDYVSNAGGVIDVVCEGTEYTDEKVFAAVDAIYNGTYDLLHLSAMKTKSPSEVAQSIVKGKLELIRNKREEKCVEFLA